MTFWSLPSSTRRFRKTAGEAGKAVPLTRRMPPPQRNPIPCRSTGLKTRHYTDKKKRQSVKHYSGRVV
jgi:hypothetical protein